VELESSADESSREEIAGETWNVLYFALTIYLRSHSSGIGEVSREELEDLASEKSLELLRRIVSGTTELSDRSPPEIMSFLSKVARNRLLDLLRARRRHPEPREDDRTEWETEGKGLTDPVATTVAPDLRLEQKEFARALRICVERLDPRSRLAWFFRVFYDMPSKDIAVHPKICLKVGHVDVMLQRCRLAIRECMHRQGFEPRDMPPGTYAELWQTFRPEKVLVPGVSG
jgi:RNA polymerase sigma-70 factor (ECF subfamily)